MADNQPIITGSLGRNTLMDGMLGRTATALAASLWVLALTLMVVATFGDRLLFGNWSLFTSIAAATVTAWCFMRSERHRVDTIAKLLSKPRRGDEGLRQV